MGHPVVDDELAIHPDADPFVAYCGECVALGESRLQLARPADAEGVGIDAGAGRAGTRTKGDGFGSRESQAGEILVEEILAGEAGAGQVQTRVEQF